MKPMKEQKKNKPEETKEVDQKAGVELSDEEMDGVAGGGLYDLLTYNPNLHTDSNDM